MRIVPKPASHRRNRPPLAAALLLVFFHSTPSALAQSSIDPGEPFLEIARRLEPWLTAEIEQKGIPALSIALVDDQSIVWARGFGFADPAKRVPATAESVYRVGSVSKLFTDLALMQLIEQGKIDLDAPVSTYLPEFAPKNPFKGTITLRHLMSHRSGLVREPPAGHYFDPSPPSLNDVVKSLAHTSLIFEPGTRTKYSNAGVTVVGALIEKVAGQPFATAIDRALLRPLAMSRTSFEPSADLSAKMAQGKMWTYDGQTVATPTFLLGTGPAGNMVSSVVDLSRFLSFLFADGKSPNGNLIKPETLRAMIEPQFAKPGESPGFGLGFAVSKLDDERRIGHGGAIYGFATEVQALPGARLGAIVVATTDCANGFTRRVAETALRLMLAARRGQPLPRLESTKPVPLARAAELTGRYIHGEKAIDLTPRNGKLYLSPFGGETTVEVRSLGDSLVIDDKLAFSQSIKAENGHLVLATESFEKQPAAKPPAPLPARWHELIGEYGWDHDVLYILEKNGKLHALIEWFFDYPLEEEAPDIFRFPDFGLYVGEKILFHRDSDGKVKSAEAAAVVFTRRRLDGENGKTFKIKPVRALEALSSRVGHGNPTQRNRRFPETRPRRPHHSGPFDQARYPVCDRQQLSRCAGLHVGQGFHAARRRRSLGPRPPLPRIPGFWPVDSRRLSPLAHHQDILGRRPRIWPDLRRRSRQGVEAQPGLRRRLDPF